MLILPAMDVGRPPEPAIPAAAAILSAELEASLTRELARVWRDLNHNFFKGSMKTPILRLIPTRDVLGRWDRRLRTIELARPFVLEASWGSVIEVLKHEMAHQYAHEVLGALDESAHGPAFRQVCERLGIDAAASGPVPPQAPSERDQRRARLVKRVTDLLALARSSNRHEAENAAAVAQRLMLKHNIELGNDAERARFGFRHLGEPKGRVQESEHILAALLAEHFFVEAIWVPAYRPHDGKRGSVLEICGTADNLELAGYVHAFLLGTAERLWLEHKREHRIASNRDRRTYLAGVMEGFRDRLATEKKRSQKEGLVWVKDADLQRYQRVRHPYVRSVRLMGHGMSEARVHGRAAGRNIVLHRGVTSSGGGTRGALPPRRS
jgi:SprT-like family protein/uncharacterized protein DUF2786